MPVNVAFYSDALTSGRYGLGRYAWELLRALGNWRGDLNVRPVSAHVALSDEELATLKAETGFTRLPWPRKLTAGLWSTFGAPPIEHWVPWADVVHCVELDYCVATRKPLVVTVHDLGPLTHPDFFSASHPWLLKRALKNALRSAAAIICVSQATASAVEHYAKEPLDYRLVIIPEGVSAEFFQPANHECFATTREFMKSAAPYFLWAGSLNPRKNLLQVIEAFERVADKLPHHLMLTGDVGWDSAETLRRVRNSSISARVHLPGHVSGAELRGLYQRASAFVYVSLMEGFGLPILEAMASGCPVIASNCSSMPEVAGEDALLVEPTNVDEIAGAMLRLGTNAPLAKQLSERGRQRAEKFRWNSCAAAVAEIYQRVRPAVIKTKRAPLQPRQNAVPTLPSSPETLRPT